MLAIIEIKGKQYRVSAGDTIIADRIEGDAGSVIAPDRVLLTEKNGKTDVGTPVVKGAKVELKIVSQEKGEKINVRRYKSKVRYRKSTGFRAKLTKLEVVSIA